MCRHFIFYCVFQNWIFSKKVLFENFVQKSRKFWSTSRHSLVHQESATLKKMTSINFSGRGYFHLQSWLLGRVEEGHKEERKVNKRKLVPKKIISKESKQRWISFCRKYNLVSMYIVFFFLFWVKISCYS